MKVLTQMKSLVKLFPLHMLREKTMHKRTINVLYLLLDLATEYEVVITLRNACSSPSHADLFHFLAINAKVHLNQRRNDWVAARKPFSSNSLQRSACYELGVRHQHP